MLSFFRKYQKIFFFVVTFFVVVSFSFFGAFKSYAPTSQMSAKIVGKALDGSSITDRDLAAIERILTTDTKKSGMPNFLHGDYLEKVFLEPKIADVLVTRFFSLLEGDLNQCLQKVKSHRPYAHPEAPFINAMEVWMTFAPKIKESYQALLAQKEATPETFILLSTLYLEQKKFSQDFVRKMLMLQIKQYSWLREDPMLQQRNLSLLGLDSVKDWFGPGFIQLLSRCIINGAVVAKEKGYRISPKEARADLLHNVITTVESTYNQKISLKDASGYLFQESNLLGLEEKGAMVAWQKALMFRRLLDSVGETVFHDPLLYDTFASFASETAKIDLFELPSELQLSSFFDLMKFQVYLEKTAPQYAKSLDLPEKLLSAEEVNRVCPELVEEKIYLEMRSVSLEELALGISLKETWAWEGDEASWKVLQDAFEELKKTQAQTLDQRLACLDALEDELRLKIDQFARQTMVKETPERIQEALLQAEPQKQWMRFRSAGAVSLPIKGVKDPRAFLKKLKNVELLENFSEDGIHYYTLKVLEKGEENQLLTFAEAKEDAAFVKLVDQKLEEAYPKVRERDLKRFQLGDGKWKPLSEVKDILGAYLFASVLRDLEKAEKRGEEKITFPFYSMRRFAPFMRKIKAQLERGEDQSKWIESESNIGSIPWKMVRREVDVSRGSSEGLDVEEIFSLDQGQWSKVMTPSNGSVAFYQLLSRSESSENSVATLNEKGKAVLSAEAKRVYFKELAQLFSEKQVISLEGKEEEL